MYAPCDQEASASPACVVVLDAERRLLQASPGASELLANGRSLSISHGILCAGSNGTGARLATAIRAVLSGDASERTIRIEEGCIAVTIVMVEGVNGVRQIVATLRQISQNWAVHLGQTTGPWWAVTVAQAAT